MIAFDLCGDDDEADADAHDPADAADAADGGPDAEIYVSVERARAVARERGEEDWTGELLLYGVHGALHLCGYDDHEPEERRAMRRAELEVLAGLGIRLDAKSHEEA